MEERRKERITEFNKVIRVFENRVLRRVFGLHNEELNDL
jgi:hypothetical protein